MNRPANAPIISAFGHELYTDLVADLERLPDAPLSEVTPGKLLVSVTAGHSGLASRVCPPGTCGMDVPLPELPTTAFVPGSSATAAVAAHLLHAPPADPLPMHWLLRSLALATLNALLPVPPDASIRKAQELIATHGSGRNVAVVGHFPFVGQAAQHAGRLSVLEIYPQPGDLPHTRAPEVLPDADLVLLTATTLTNGTLPGLLQLCRPDAFVILLGPSTPFSPVLFDYGVNVLGGTVVTAPDVARAGIREGLPYRALQGVQSLCWGA